LSKELLNSVFSSKQVQRKFPIQAALHIVLDGALLGILITVAIMSSVALHSQYLWTKSFTKLETTRDLNRRTLESTSILESYLLKNQKLSRNLVPTKAEDLIYVDRPKPEETKKSFDVTLKSRFLEKISSFPVKSGY
jgi:ABC-type antimicrobial peptide transport system permease subunit